MKEDKVDKYIGSSDLSFLWEDEMKEAVGRFNVGFEEMVKFYNEATPQEIEQMKKIVQKNDWNRFKSLIKKVIGVELI